MVTQMRPTFGAKAGRTAPLPLPWASSPDRYISVFLKKNWQALTRTFLYHMAVFSFFFVTCLYQSYPQSISSYRKQRGRTGAGYRAGGSTWTLAYKSYGRRPGGDSPNGFVTGVVERVDYCSTCFAWPLSDLLHQVNDSCRRGSRKQEIPDHRGPTGAYFRIVIEAPFVPSGMAIYIQNKK